MSDAFAFALGALCVWRITYLLTAEDGPGHLLDRLRRRLADTPLGRLLDCFYCVSLWAAAPIALTIGGAWTYLLLLWFALSAGAIMIERLTAPAGPTTAAYLEDDKENPDELLRTSPATRPDREHS
jgi:hypothetical protein